MLIEISQAQCSWYWKVIFTLPEENGNHKYHPATNSMIYHSDLPTRHTESAIVGQKKKYGSNQLIFLLDLNSTPQD